MALAVRTRSYTNLAASISFYGAALRCISTNRRSKVSVPSLIFCSWHGFLPVESQYFDATPNQPACSGTGVTYEYRKRQPLRPAHFSSTPQGGSMSRHAVLHSEPNPHHQYPGITRVLADLDKENYRL
jgi:hypothetical protein